jgi:FG-GAP-like repeat
MTKRPSGSSFRILSVSALFLICGVLLIAAPLGFTPPTSYPVQSGPTGIVVADFNGDRKVDLVVPNVEAGSISVFLGKGDGTFLPPNNYPLIDDSGTPIGSPSVVVGQFTRKGKKDVAIVNSNRNAVDILLGDGKGGFTKGVTLRLPDMPFGIVAGDFNHDGKLDLAVTSVDSPNYAAPGKINVFLGNGDGTFQPPITTPVGVNLYSVDAADFDGDKKLDLVVTTMDRNNPRRVVVLFGLGNGSFRAPLNLDAGLSPWAVRVGRFDKTKHYGFAVLGQFSGVTVFSGDGHGKFSSWASPWPMATILQPMTFAELRSQNKTPDTVHSLAVADFNHDGVDDVSVGNPPGYVQVMLGDGSGKLNPATSYPLGNAASGGLTNWELVAADLNGDKYPDLISTNLTGVPTKSFISVAINQH